MRTKQQLRQNCACLTIPGTEIPGSQEQRPPQEINRKQLTLRAFRALNVKRPVAGSRLLCHNTMASRNVEMARQ